MATIDRPAVKPANPRFSTGPTTKRPGWSPEFLKQALTGRSHRSSPAKARLAKAIDETRRILGVPADYRVAIVPASDTGAMEMALWSLLGARGVDVLAWESFGIGWADDAQVGAIDYRRPCRGGLRDRGRAAGAGCLR